jgi:RNA polymerase sigma factor (TIGR02999 family)
VPLEPPIPSEITRLLSQWKEGDREALQSVVSLAYDELHSIATGYFRREAPGHTLQATALVNELFVRLVQVRGVQLKDRRHFYAFAAQLMRMILIDYSRQAKALKRPSSAERVPLHEEMAWVDAASEEMLALNTALDELEAVDERKVRVIELRFFLGCTNEETSELIDVSRATVDRDLEFAKTWLYRRLTRQPRPASPNPISARHSDGLGQPGDAHPS